MKYAEDMKSGDNSGFETMLTNALERREDVAVPADFAARVRAALPAVRTPRRAMQAGRTVAVASVGVLAVAMFAVAPHAAPSFGSMAFDFELVAILQMAGIGYWLTVRDGRA